MPANRGEGNRMYDKGVYLFSGVIVIRYVCDFGV